jgi:hypothetical protein
MTLGLQHQTAPAAPLSQASLSVRIADININLGCAWPEMRLWLEEAASRFQVAESSAPDVRVMAGWGDLTEAVRGEQLFDSGALWRLYRAGDGRYVYSFSTSYFGSQPYKMAVFNQDFTSGEVYLHRPYFDTARAVYPLEYPLDELLLLNILARGKGAEFHSCGIVDASGNGRLFLGQSGAGKSTTAGLWEQRAGAHILSDDRIIVRRAGEGFQMYGTPWHGESKHGSPSSAPLKQIFFLRQALRNELTPLKRAEAAARLFACSFPPFYDTRGLEFTLGFLEEMVCAVPCYELDFLRDESAVDYVRQVAQ